MQAIIQFAVIVFVLAPLVLAVLWLVTCIGCLMAFNGGACAIDGSS